MIARLVVIAIVFLAVFYGWRALVRFRGKRDDDAGERRRLKSSATDALELERDPKTGVYKPGDTNTDKTEGGDKQPGD
jgi:hypothetical protein